MDKYLKLLLEQDNTIIIPGLGALMVTNEETKELMFNEYLKFNDGKLDKFIVANSSMDEQEAQNFVAKYVREIQMQLEKGESYDMFQFGSFSKNKDGKIEFSKWGTKKPVASAKAKKEETKEAPLKKETPKVDKKKEVPVKKKEPKTEKKKEVTPPIITPPAAKEKAEEIKAKVEEKVTEVKQEFKETKSKLEQAIAEKEAEAKKEIADAKTKIETPKKNVYIPPVTESVSKTAETVTAKAEEIAKPVVAKGADEPTNKIEITEEKKEEKKKKSGIFFWILMLLLLIVAGTGIYAAFNYDKVKSMLGWDHGDLTEINVEKDKTPVSEIKEEEIITPEVSSDSTLVVVEDNANAEETSENTEEIVEEPIAEEISEPVKEVETVTTPIASSTGNYHVIGGSFGDASNAESLVSILREKGFDASVLGQFGSLTTVSVQSYNSREEAQAALSNIRNEVEGAYVMKHPK